MRRTNETRFKSRGHRGGRRRGALRTAMVIASFSLAMYGAGPILGDELATPGFDQSFLTELTETTDKLFQLAEAVSVTQFDRRPQVGVRSMREVYVHLAAANFVLSEALGIEAPRELGFRPEGGGLVFDVEATITDKAEVLEFLDTSLAHVRRATALAASQDLGEEVAFFGIQRERRRILLGLITHHSQHLGQCVAYARQMGVTPPWTAAALAQQR